MRTFGGGLLLGVGGDFVDVDADGRDFEETRNEIKDEIILHLRSVGVRVRVPI